VDDMPLSEDYAVPTKEVYCDCVLSHNGLGLVGRICDCRDENENLELVTCEWPRCDCQANRCNALSYSEINKRANEEDILSDGRTPPHSDRKPVDVREFVEGLKKPVNRYHGVDGKVYYG
jgi:hypothetical protein